MAFAPPSAGTVWDIVTTKGPFRIPLYQRGYAWKPQQIEDFARDILRLAQISGDKEHFFGTTIMVTEERPNNKPDRQRSVVDGQQRLTTFMLAFLVLAEALESLSESFDLTDALQSAAKADAEEKAREIRSLILTYADRDLLTAKTSRRDMLTLDAADYEVFAALVHRHKATASTSSQKRLKNAHALLRKALAEDPIKRAKNQMAAYEFLLSVHDALRYNSYVLVFEVNSNEKAYQLFSILNDRGAPLTEADLLRTRMLELTSGHLDLVKRVEKHWATLRSQDENLLVFLRHHHSSYSGERWPSTRLYAHLSKSWSLDKDLPSRVEAEAIADRCEVLDRECRVWRALDNGEWPFPKGGKASEWSRSRLHRLVVVQKQVQVLPLLLAAAETLDEEVFAGLILKLELATFRYRLCGGHPSEFGDEVFAEAGTLRALGRGYSNHSLDRRLRKLLVKYAPDPVFRTRFNEVSYSGGNSLELRHILTTLADYSGPPETPWELPAFKHSLLASLSQLQVEHIYPQNAKPGEVVSELEPIKHRLGNLTYWDPSDNKAASNMKFADKVSWYRESKIVENHLIGALAHWDTSSVEARQERLVDRAMLVWSAPGGPIASSAEGRNPRWFLVRQEEESPWPDSEGKTYAYKRSLPNGLQIQDGDVLICARRSGGKGSPLVLFGVGHVGKVKSLGTDGLYRSASYSNYLPIDPALPIVFNGGAPILQNRNFSMNEVDANWGAKLLEALGISSLSDLPAV